jgi:hypothetical protein
MKEPLWFIIVSWFAIWYTVFSLAYLVKVHRDRRAAKKRALQLLVLKTTQNLGMSSPQHSNFTVQKTETPGPNFEMTWTDEISEETE